MNEIHYMVTVEDIAHLNHHHFRSSPRARRGSFLRVAGSIGMLFISYFAFMAMLGINAPGMLIIVFMFMTASLVHAYTRKKPNRTFVKRVKRLFDDGRNVNLFGQHHLLLHEDHVEVRTPYSQGTIRWEAIERVEQDEEYIFIYTSSLNAHIIHKRFFPTPGHAQAFFELAQRARRVGFASLALSFGQAGPTALCPNHRNVPVVGDGHHPSAGRGHVGSPPYFPVNCLFFADKEQGKGFKLMSLNLYCCEG